MKIKIAGAVVLAACLAGCSTTPEQLESSKSTARQTRNFPDNYQALYRKSTDRPRAVLWQAAEV